ncbi:hypothetical protein Ancab_036718 [Ancistrocladus abbreviatus]
MVENFEGVLWRLKSVVEMGEFDANSGEEMEVEVERNVKEEEEDSEKRENGSEVVRWEKYLPRMVIRILLVESDYSTRQIIAALLRKCNYKVAAIPDGLKAWEILKQRHNNIDLILTELDLPSISGYALLTLIMEHEACKNIPVIMMSSHDSINMVFKCLLKGAADFLLKPVRRNELKNLWQHVWKRLVINGGHNPQNTTTGQYNEAMVKKDRAPNNSLDNVSSGGRNNESSDGTSDAQSSCTTRYVEAESACMENMQGISQLKHRRAPDMCHNGLSQCETNMKLDQEPIVASSEIKEKSTGFGSSQVMPCNEGHASTVLTVEEDGSCAGRMTEDESLGPEIHRHICTSSQLPEPSGEEIDLIGRIDDRQCTLIQSSPVDERNQLAFAPQLELSLRSLDDLQNQRMDEGNRLNHSNVSAFSWYGNNKKLPALFPQLSRTCAEIRGGESRCNRLLVACKDVGGPSLWLSIPTSSEEKNKSCVVVSQSAPPKAEFPYCQHGHFLGKGIMFGGTPAGYGSLPSMVGPKSDPVASSPNSAHQLESSPFLPSPSLHSDPGSHSSSVRHCRVDGASNQPTHANVHEHAKVETGEQNSFVNVAPAASQSATSTLCNDLTSHLKGSAYGSTDGNAASATSNKIASMGSSVIDDGTNIETHDQFGGKVSCPNTQREAALMKFRLKRKERCYEKKVRYQSRKKLAEQRPRVKGQFVRQVHQSPADADGSYEYHA